MSKIFFYLIISSFLQSAMIQHKDVTNSFENSSIKVEVLINSDYENIKNVTLYYKSNEQSKFLQRDMLHTKDNFFNTEIPKDYVTMNGIV